MGLKNWKSKKNRTYEDKLLLKYWRRVGGLIYTEVLFGKGLHQKWPKGSKPRRIDAVRIVLRRGARINSNIVVFKSKVNAEEFEKHIHGADVEIIEIQEDLDRKIIGQAVVGVHLLKMYYKPSKIIPTTLSEIKDPLLEQVCK